MSSENIFTLPNYHHRPTQHSYNLCSQMLFSQLTTENKLKKETDKQTKTIHTPKWKAEPQITESSESTSQHYQRSNHSTGTVGSSKIVSGF